MESHSNFLTQLLERDKRRYERRPVRLEATVSCMRTGLRGHITQRVVILNISEGGCMLSCPDADSLTDEFHIAISGLGAKIGCTVVGRSAVQLNIRFTEILPTSIVDRLARKGA